LLSIIFCEIPDNKTYAANYYYAKYNVNYTPPSGSLGPMVNETRSDTPPYPSGYNSFKWSGCTVIGTGGTKPINSSMTSTAYVIFSDRIVFVEYATGQYPYRRFERYINCTPEKYTRGSFIENVIAPDGTYPNDGRHSDGYWYVKGSIANTAPTITLSTTNNQTLSEVTGYNTISINGTAKDTDVGDTLTIKYTIDGVSGHTNQIVQSITANGNNQPYSKNITINSSIPQGTRTLRVWAEDNKGGKSTEVTISFNVDKTPPTPATISASPSGSAPSKTITIGFAGDAATKQYRINSGSWLNYTGPFSITETSIIETRSIDSVGNTSTSSQSIEVAPPIPTIIMVDRTENSITIKDQTSYSYPVERRFIISEGSLFVLETSSWLTDSEYRFTNLSPNKKYKVKIEVRYR
jgi:hypothetical protein